MTVRLRAPTEDGGLLEVPPLADFGEQLDRNQRLFTRWPQVAGRSIASIRQETVAEAIRLATDYHLKNGEPLPAVSDRLIVAGHQPEIYHPGVWAKNFALSRLSRSSGVGALNLIADHDIAKKAAIRVPILSDDPAKVGVEEVLLDRCEHGIAHEEQWLVDPEMFDATPARCEQFFRSWPFEPMLSSVWKSSRSVQGRKTVGEVVSQARRRVERLWGTHHWELPVSRLSTGSSFALFAWRLLSDAAKLADDYNHAVRTYRQANRLKSQNHPAPELGRQGTRVEAPFWAWRAGENRKRLFVERLEQQIAVFAGDVEIGRVGPGSDEFMVWWQSQAEWKLRPRALTLTMFARCFLGESFIHGIGGGKYDEVTDEIIRRFFGVEPPGYMVMTATLRLPFARFSGSPEDLQQARQSLRDLRFAPDRHPDAMSSSPDLVAARRLLLENRPTERAAKRNWYRDVTGLAQRIGKDLRKQQTHAQNRMDQVKKELEANGVLGSREFAWMLFPETTLRPVMERIASGTA